MGLINTCPFPKQLPPKSFRNKPLPNCELEALPGPFCDTLAPEPPTKENSPKPTPLLAPETPRGEFKGGVLRRRLGAPARITFALLQKHQSTHLVWRLPVLRCSTTTCHTGPGVKTSEFTGQGKDKSKGRGVYQHWSFPSASRASTWEERRGSTKGCRVSSSPGEGRTPVEAPPTRPDSAQLEAGPLRGRECGTRPQESAMRFSVDLTRPAQSSPRGAAFAPTSCHLSQLRWQCGLRTNPCWRERTPTLALSTL